MEKENKIYCFLFLFIYNHSYMSITLKQLNKSIIVLYFFTITTTFSFNQTSILKDFYDTKHHMDFETVVQNLKLDVFQYRFNKSSNNTPLILHTILRNKLKDYEYVMAFEDKLHDMRDYIMYHISVWKYNFINELEIADFIPVFADYFKTNPYFRYSINAIRIFFYNDLCDKGLQAQYLDKLLSVCKIKKASNKKYSSYYNVACAIISSIHELIDNMKVMMFPHHKKQTYNNQIVLALDIILLKSLESYTNIKKIMKSIEEINKIEEFLYNAGVLFHTTKKSRQFRSFNRSLDFQYTNLKSKKINDYNTDKKVYIDNIMKFTEETTKNIALISYYISNTIYNIYERTNKDVFPVLVLKYRKIITYLYQINIVYYLVNINLYIGCFFMNKSNKVYNDNINTILKHFNTMNVNLNNIYYYYHHLYYTRKIQDKSIKPFL